MTRGVSEQPRFDFSRTEQPLYACSGIHHQGPDQLPVSSLIECEGAASSGCEAIAVEREPSGRTCCDSGDVANEEREICVAPRAMASVPIVRAAACAGQIADEQRIASRKRLGHGSCRTLDGRDQRGRPVSCGLARAKSSIAFAAIG